MRSPYLIAVLVGLTALLGSIPDPMQAQSPQYSGNPYGTGLAAYSHPSMQGYSGATYQYRPYYPSMYGGGYSSPQYTMGGGYGNYSQGYPMGYSYPGVVVYFLPPMPLSYPQTGQSMHSQQASGYQSPASGRSSFPQLINIVVARDNYFEPYSIAVPTGTTVRWINQGVQAHTVTSNDGNLDSGDIAPGKEYTKKFDRPGTYYFYCKHHVKDRMQGVVYVADEGGRIGYVK